MNRPIRPDEVDAASGARYLETDADERKVERELADLGRRVVALVGERRP